MNTDPGGSNNALKLKALCVFATVLLVTNFGITQWVASRLSYHPDLGAHVNHLYQPFAWISWQKYYDGASTTFNIAYMTTLIVMALSVTVIVVWVGNKTRSAHQDTRMHGTAHWATRKEIEQSGLMAAPGKKGSGVYVGGWRDPDTELLHYLRHDGPEHIACAAPTRSGKGVGLVVPTCLSWEHSIVINDRKGELWNLTSGWRSTEGKNICMRFNPSWPHFDPNDPNYEETAAFNPLDEVRIGTNSEVGDTQNITAMIVDPDGKGLVDHWQKTAFAFLTGALIHEAYKAKAQGRTATLYDVIYGISDPNRDIAEYYEEMMMNRHDVANLYGENGVHPLVAAEGRTMLNKPDDERGSVLSTAVSYLSLYRDPIVRHHTRRSDFSIMDLMNAEKPVSLYLVSRDEDKDRMKPLLRLILNQILRVLLRPELEFVDGRPKMPHKHRLLLMLDEFPSFGKLEIVQEALAFIAGYGIKAYLIMQDLAQLWDTYGKDETITANTQIIIGYAPNKVETAEWFSKKAGTTTITKWQITESGKRYGAITDQYSRTATETSRPLITPDETTRLRAPVKDKNGTITEPGDMLIFSAGHAPIFGTQSLFFLDETFLSRSKIPPPANGSVRPPGATAQAGQTSLGSALWGTP